MSDLINQVKSKAVTGPGLKSAGIVVLQGLIIFIIESIEYDFDK